MREKQDRGEEGGLADKSFSAVFAFWLPGMAPYRTPHSLPLVVRGACPTTFLRWVGGGPLPYAYTVTTTEL